MDARELADCEALRDLVARYAHAADRGRFEELAALFAEDGRLELPDGRTLAGPRAIRDALADTAQALRAAASAPMRHHVSSHRIVLDGPDAAGGWAYFLVLSGRGPDHWGRYVDRYVRAADGWRFASRRVRLDGRTNLGPDPR